MMRSLYSGVSGLRIHQTKMDVIGNNISNVNTVGFKSSSVLFTDILYQTTQNASGPNSEAGTAGKNAMQIGLGATVGSISTKMTTGAAQRTDNALDVMINGDAFFIVNDGSSNYFTKAGSFTVDANGTLCTSTGLSVMGYQPNAEGNGVIVDKVSQLNIMSPDKKYTEPAATSKAHFTGNIDKTDRQLETGRDVTLSFYDNRGEKYTATFTFKADTTATGTTDKYEVSIKDLTDGSGKSILQVGTTADATHRPVTFGTGTDTTATIEFDGSTGKFKTINAGTATAEGNKTLTLKIGGTPNPFGTDGIEIDFSKLTAFADSGASTAECMRGESAESTTGSGKPVGNLKGLAISDSGLITGNYDNGDKKILGQIAVATFSNPAGLESVGNSLFSATLNSGEFNGVGQTITSVGTTMTSGVLEMSNVDLATEFTELIVAQRGYQSNSRIISTSDSLLEELINLKR